MASTFHFTDKAPDAQLFADVQNLKAFDDGQLRDFVAITLSYLQNTTSDEPTERLAAFCTTHGVNQKALRNTVRGVLFFFTESLRRNLAPQSVQEDLVRLGLDESKASILRQQWKGSFIAMSQSAIGKTLTVNEVIDMEWKFGVTAATSEVSRLGATFLQLKLVIDRGLGKHESVVMELTLPQFYEFLREMQSANRQCS